MLFSISEIILLINYLYIFRRNNSFWTYIEKNGRNNSGLSISTQLELIYYWCQDIKQTTIIALTGRSHHTVCDCNAFLRDMAQVF